MKNVSLPSLQAQSMKNSPVKNPVEPASKSDVSVGGVGPAISPFQLALSKQVEAKHAHQVATKQRDANNIGAKLPSPKKTVDGGSGAEVDEARPAAFDGKMERVGGLLNEDLMPKEAFAAEKDVSAEGNAVFVAAPSVITPIMLAPVINADAQLAATTLSGIEKQISLEASSSNALSVAQEDSVSVNQNYDAALSKVLSANKKMNVPESDAGNTQSTQNNLNNNGASEHAQWLDAMLPAASKQNFAATEHETAMVKLEYAIKGTIESGLKEAAPSVSFQAALHANAAGPTQQVGSTNAIASYPGRAGWDQAISQKVMWMVGASELSATLTLNPPDLGPLQVVIRVHNDQADATFISDNAEVRQALENGMSNLRDKMSESGIQLGQANVSAGNQSQQEFQRATQNRLAARANDTSGVPPQLSMEETKAQVHHVNGLVDTFA